METEEFEKLGAFYLGREYDLGAGEVLDPPVLYDSKDLVTHGVVLGMTGSGKTGLCISILEEAGMDSVPAIVIDPKGDLGNLLLTFPELRGEDFEPWVNEEDALKKGLSVEEYAENRADLWRDGLADWGEDGGRIQRFRDKVDMTIYTPGSSAGVPVSILGSLDPPPDEVLASEEFLGERIETTAMSLLSLLGIDADPISDPEFILLALILRHFWKDQRESVTLKILIESIQNPPVDKIGVMDVEAVMPAKKRFGLAVRLNNLLASPGFATWLAGEPLDVQRMLYTEEGKPRISIFSIAHLSDAERMFFVSLLLNQMLGWMRSQSGTTSLRALLYMDEIFGYLPPTANPPSKKPLLTMLKQARAYGLGCLLATQNPVDLDYKALSNMGTWFLGRLQTERDKMRVLDGLEGAAASQDSGFDRGRMEEVLAGLGSRVFLMNNVHEEAPVTFHVRWAMSYLRGPLTRKQISRLMKDKKAAAGEEVSEPSATEADDAAEAIKEAAADVDDAVVEEAIAAASAAREEQADAKNGAPALPRGVDQWFFPAQALTSGAEVTYVPSLMRSARVKFSKASLGVRGEREMTFFQPVGSGDGIRRLDQSRALALPQNPKPVQESQHPGAEFAPLPEDAEKSSAFTAARDDFIDWLYDTCKLQVFQSKMLGAHSKLGESEGEFRARLVQLAREKRDELTEDMRARYESRFRKLEEQLERAAEALDREREQASSAQVESAMSIGSTLLGAIMGRKLSRRTSSAVRRTREAAKQRGDVRQAKEKVASIEDKIETLDAELQTKFQEIELELNPLTEKFGMVSIKPYKKDIRVERLGILWLPHVRDESGELRKAY